MNNEIDYYENENLWKSDFFFQNEAEMKRMDDCILLIPNDVDNICDIGAGNGVFLAVLEKKDIESMLKVGVERSGAAISNKACDCEIIQGDIKELPFANQKFDMVTCMEVIEHLPEDTYFKGLAEIERVAAKYILISVPYRERRSVVSCPSCDATFNPYFHMRSFEEEKMQTLFKKFDLVKIVLSEKKKELKSRIAQMNDFRCRILNKKGFMNNMTLCPQCGHKENTGAVDRDSQITKTTKMKQFVINCFSEDKPRWMIALYQKKETRACQHNLMD